MPNHFHFLIHSNEHTVAPAAALRCEGRIPKVDMSNFSHGMKMLLSSYTKGVNKQLGLSGSLFTQNTNAKQVSSEFSAEDYVLNCFRYIHRNPFSAGLVQDLADWEYSSFPDYAGLRKGTLCDLSFAKNQLMLDWHEFKHETLREISSESLLKIW